MPTIEERERLLDALENEVVKLAYTVIHNIDCNPVNGDLKVEKLERKLAAKVLQMADARHALWYDQMTEVMTRFLVKKEQRNGPTHE